MRFAVLLFAACAHTPASQPASAASRSDALPCLDVQGQRELLAGIELEAGAQAASLARCNVQRTAAEHYADAQQKRADDANTRTAWVSAIAAVLAAAITAGVEALAHKGAP